MTYRRAFAMLLLCAVPLLLVLPLLAMTSFTASGAQAVAACWPSAGWTLVAPSEAAGNGRFAENMIPVPGAPGQLLAPGPDGIYTSADCASTWSLVAPWPAGTSPTLKGIDGKGTMYAIDGSGVLWVTADRGKTWESRSQRVSSIAVSLAPDGLLYALWATEGEGVTLNRSHDEGRTWRTVAGEIHRPDFAAASLQTPDTVFYVLDRNSFRQIQRTSADLDCGAVRQPVDKPCARLVGSTDGGDTWSEVSGFESFPYSGYSSATGYSSTHGSVASLDGTRIWLSAGRLFGSSDSGNSWRLVGTPPGVKVVTLIANPWDPQAVFVRSDAGLWSYRDVAMTLPVRGNGLPIPRSPQLSGLPGNRGLSFTAPSSLDADFALRVMQTRSHTAAAPSVGERYVVWQDARDGGWAIYGYDLQDTWTGSTGFDRPVMKISDTACNNIAPRTSGSIVVWQRECRPNAPGPATSDIYGIRPPSGSSFVVHSDDTRNVLPDTDGRYVVWLGLYGCSDEDCTAAAGVPMAKDLETGTAWPLAADARATSIRVASGIAWWGGTAYDLVNRRVLLDVQPTEKLLAVADGVAIVARQGRLRSINLRQGTESDLGTWPGEASGYRESTITYLPSQRVLIGEKTTQPGVSRLFTYDLATHSERDAAPGGGDGAGRTSQFGDVLVWEDHWGQAQSTASDIVINTRPSSPLAATADGAWLPATGGGIQAFSSFVASWEETGQIYQYGRTSALPTYGQTRSNPTLAASYGLAHSADGVTWQGGSGISADEPEPLTYAPHGGRLYGGGSPSGTRPESGEVTVVPSDPPMMYRAGGVSWSVDRGESWSEPGMRLCDAPITASPVSPRQIYLVGCDHVFRSTYLDEPPAPVDLPNAIWRSDDAGQSWTPTLVLPNASATVTVSPWDPSIVYAAVFSSGDRPNSVISTARGLWRSLDAGLTWTQLRGGFEATRLDFVPTDSTHQALLLRKSDDLVLSTDNGATWTRLGRPEISYGIYNQIVAQGQAGAGPTYCEDSCTRIRDFMIVGDRVLVGGDFGVWQRQLPIKP